MEEGSPDPENTFNTVNGDSSNPDNTFDTIGEDGEEDGENQMHISSYLYEPTLFEYEDESEEEVEEEDEEDHDDDNAPTATTTTTTTVGPTAATVSEQPQLNRMTKNWWCMCGKWCQPQKTRGECICCTELESFKKILDSENLGRFCYDTYEIYLDIWNFFKKLINRRGWNNGGELHKFFWFQRNKETTNVPLLVFSTLSVNR